MRWMGCGGVRIVCAVFALVAWSRHGAAAEPPFQELARRTVGAGQGVYAVAEDGTVLADLNSSRAVHPASVTKAVTTLVLLRELGPDHRFMTSAVATGPIDHGTLEGDLVITSEADPFLVSESALLLLAELRRLGIDRVEGKLRVEGPLLFNWKPDPAGNAMGAVLAGSVDETAWRAFAAQRADVDGQTPRSLGLRFEQGKVGASENDKVLVTHRSPSLKRILKELNGYSNNIFHLVSDRVGGPAAVERAARATVPVEMRDEIIITNAAGAGKTNRLSPRATVALLGALEAESSRRGLELVDLLPVAGYDRGTLHDRFDTPELRGALVGKTGTFGSLGACALAGVARTRKYGVVRFAILNKDVPVPEARRRQNDFMEALLRDAGPVPWPYSPPDSPVLAEESLEVVSPRVESGKRPARRG